MAKHALTHVPAEELKKKILKPSNASPSSSLFSDVIPSPAALINPKGQAAPFSNQSVARYKGVQRAEFARNISQTLGNARLQKLVAQPAPRPDKFRKDKSTKSSSRLPDPKTLNPLAGGIQFKSYAAQFQPPATGWMMMSQPGRAAAFTRSIQRAPEDEKTSPPPGVPAPAPAPAEEKKEPEESGTFSLALYDYNVDHMVAYESTKKTFLDQWQSYLGGKTSKSAFYKSLESGGYLEKAYGEKVKEHQEYMVYAAEKSRLESKLKTAKGKSKDKFQEELDNLEAAAPVAEINNFLTKTAKEVQKESFKGWANEWGKEMGAEVYGVTSDKEAESKTAGVISSNSPAKLQMIALFGHGSDYSGWINMGDVGKMLLKDNIKSGLSTDLQVYLYMCSAGKGGEKSFAAKLAGKLKKAGMSGTEVWAHTNKGSAYTNPNWVLYKDLESGSPFYQTVFDETYIKSEETRLVTNWESQENLLALSKGILNIRSPKTVEEMMRNWYARTGNMSETSEAIAFAPQKSKESSEKLRSAWQTFIDAELQKKKAIKDKKKGSQ